MTDWDIAFPDDERESNPTTFKIFQAAQAWAAQRGTAAGGGLSYEMPDSDDEDEEDAEDGEGGGDGASGADEDGDSNQQSEGARKTEQEVPMDEDE